MKFGIIGSGDVGRRLGGGLVQHGHHVGLGTRNPEKKELNEWKNEFSKNNGENKVFVGTFEEVSSFGEVVIISTLWEGTYNAIKIANPSNFKGKVVIDTTNPLDFSQGMPPSLSVGHSNSGGETIQHLLPDAYVVKAFNIIGNPHMINPDFPCGPPTMFICGNNSEAKKMVTDIILNPFGWETIDIGNIKASRMLEPLALLWITYYFNTGTGNHALKLLKK